jgi:hypothetical protein
MGHHHLSLGSNKTWATFALHITSQKILKFSASIMQHCRHQRFDRALAIFLLL